MNFVFVNGGWKGLKPDWNPALEMPTSSSSTTNPGLDFSSQRRSQAEQELDETIVRLRAMIVDRHTDEGLDIDFGEDDDAGGFERGVEREWE